jgi:hypothetical protein
VMGCDCAEAINDAIASFGAKLAIEPTALASERGLPCIATVANGTGEQPANIIATFCPFCGVRLRADEMAQ